MPDNKDRIIESDTPNKDNILNGICPNCGDNLHYNPSSDPNYGLNIKNIKLVYDCPNCDKSYTVYYKWFNIRESVESDLIQW